MPDETSPLLRSNDENGPTYTPDSNGLSESGGDSSGAGSDVQEGPQKSHLRIVSLFLLSETELGEQRVGCSRIDLRFSFLVK
jgi:hypothetical protein